ncbi:tripartite tricarboxylate transporter substrate binding protein [Roseomonas sp. OT10]|uniref:Bug family tripartite tricarboxylate transporter substrate binding protein n=1 Tax=Roseomonas cutis TaxID=2897332 RepID=UPI001E3AD1CD|nr:tripartite tricarboxylate transporter substrate binding protein [Roseomonas sp. OT10]UFN48169.1 tripartite tricarboxylate transporter substrate binding protein [Roseomonas sp. OT10]
MKLVVPNPPGGQSDTIARLYADALQAAAGQSVVVENRTGANGLIAMDAVARAPADGQTLGIFSVTAFNALPAMMAKMPLDVERDLFPLTSIVTSTTLCVVTAERARERGWTDFRALVDWARKPGNELTNGAAASGGASHLLCATIAKRSGAAITVVPYRGGAAALNDLLAGSIDMVFDFMPALMPHVAAGKLVPLAVGMRERIPLLPQVPGMGEFADLNLADIDLQSWNALTAPANLPAPVAAAILDGVRKANAQPGLEEKLRQSGLLMMPPLDPAGVQERLARERPLWREMVAASGARIE